MARMIEELSTLSAGEQEKVLDGLSRGEVPIQVDNRVYFIPKAVSGLIEDLLGDIADCANTD
tara:strand:+ start:226 stop:411 length:186 start_codon:yes stop_codon:yes gene_type:complete